MLFSGPTPPSKKINLSREHLDPYNTRIIALTRVENGISIGSAVSRGSRS